MPGPDGGLNGSDSQRIPLYGLGLEQLLMSDEAMLYSLVIFLG